MILLTYSSHEGLELGVKTDAGILDVRAAATALAATDVPSSPNAFYRLGYDALAPLAAVEVDALRADAEDRIQSAVPVEVREYRQTKGGVGAYRVVPVPGADLRREQPPVPHR